MKLLIVLVFCMVTLHGCEIVPYDEKTDYQSVLSIINYDDADNYFMNIPAELTQKERIDFINKNLLHPRKQFIYVAKKDNVIVGFITLTKRDAPSKKYAQKLNELGSYYDNYVTMMLSDPNIPESSDDFILRATLMVKKDQRNKGFGKKLMHFAYVQAMLDSEIIAITLDVARDNNVAIKLYESLGYKKVCVNLSLQKFSYRLNLSH